MEGFEPVVITPLKEKSGKQKIEELKQIIKLKCKPVKSMATRVRELRKQLKEQSR